MSNKIGSMRDFYEWVKMQNPSDTYEYYSIPDCAVARYSRERGVPYDPPYTYGCDHVSKLEHAAMQQNNLDNGFYEDQYSQLTMRGLRHEIETYYLKG